uniref:Uncharacterized protein n=1 Tax=Tetraodon nigroviridis TaxID=99883 RepID=H3C2Z4_TETNG
MEPEVIRMYSSSPPPMDDGPEEEEDSEFGDFGAFSAVAASISFTEFSTPSTFNQTQALNATSPPELLDGCGVLGYGHAARRHQPLKANGVVPTGHRGDAPSDRTESSSVLAGSPGHPVSEADGGGPEALTNGFVTCDLQGSPSLQNSVHARGKGTSAEDVRPQSPQDDFADFASFPDAEGGVARPEAEPRHAERRASAEDALRDPTRTRTPESAPAPAPAEAPDGSCDTDRGPGPHRPATLNGLHAADGAQAAERSPDQPSPGVGRVHGKSSDTETETETSLGRPLSTDALEEYGDLSTPGSTPSPPLQGEPATPAHHGQDGGDFGDVPGFPDFEQDRNSSSAPTQQCPE